MNRPSENPRKIDIRIAPRSKIQQKFIKVGKSDRKISCYIPKNAENNDEHDGIIRFVIQWQCDFLWIKKWYILKSLPLTADILEVTAKRYIYFYTTRRAFKRRTIGYLSRIFPINTSGDIDKKTSTTWPRGTRSRRARK